MFTDCQLILDGIVEWARGGFSHFLIGGGGRYFLLVPVGCMYTLKRIFMLFYRRITMLIEIWDPTPYDSVSVYF